MKQPNGQQRVGLGEDRHRLDEPGTGPMRLGGIVIPHDRGLVGHSDADVLLHAITDALLGALAMPDIGELFPDTADENHNRDSAEFLKLAYEKVRAAGYQLVNLDAVISAQRPKLSPYKQEMRQRIAELLECSIDQIGLKAKTGENIGAVGLQGAIDTRCIVLLTSIK